MHLIRKQIIEVELPALEPAMELQQQIGQLVQEQLNPALSAQFDRLSAPGHVLRLDQVALTVQISSVAALKEQLVGQVLQTLERVLSGAEKKERGRQSYWPGESSASPAGKSQTDEEQVLSTQISEEESVAEAFVFFLQNGYLPWWAFQGRFEEFTSKMLALLQKEPSPLLQASLTQLFQTKEGVERLAYQFSPDFLRAVLQGFPEKSMPIRSIQQAAFSLPVTAWETWKKAGLLFSPEPQSERIEQKDFSKESTPVHSEQEEIEGLYIQNAGLVLLAPFLELYLQTGGLIEAHTLTYPLEAVHWLQFLVTGQRRTPEPELLLNKLLCGLPIGTPVPADVDLPPVCEKETQNVLEAVIRYWTVLKSTSPAGLREGFLQRSGRLSRKPDGDWLLQVEQKSYDMLLESLPWSYSLIKLPWMPQALWVEWA